MKLRKFNLGDIAEISYGTKLDKNKMTHNNLKINFVSRTGLNNGISDKVDKIFNMEPISTPCLTLALGGSIGSCFVQEEPFYTGQNVGVITFPKNVSVDSLLYIATVISKYCKNRFVAFGNEINKHLKNDLWIELPTTINTYPAIDYMKKIIKSEFGPINQSINQSINQGYGNVFRNYWKVGVCYE